MILVIGIVVGCALGAAAVLAVVLTRQPPAPVDVAPPVDQITPLAEQVARLADEQRHAHEGIAALSEHTQQLREVLASSKARGQWGERMAEDVLRLAGLIEGVNYRKQATLDDGAGRPDYTFMLPNGRV